MIGVVGNALSDPGGGALEVAGALDVTAPVDVAGAPAVVLWFSPHAAFRAVAAASGQQSVDMVGSDFFRDVSL